MQKNNEQKKYVIYGAQGIALSVYEAFTKLYPDKKVECFLVTQMGNNASTLARLPVKELNDFSKSCNEKSAVQILVSTPSNVMPEIESSLKAEDFTDIILMKDEQLYDLITKASKKKLGYKSLYAYTAGDDAAKLNIYMACSKYDKPLKRKYEFPDYMTPIHVGADGPDNMNAKDFDNVGENISHKNCNYCELTGLYWEWKNVLSKSGDDDKYYGLCQYRRFLDLSREDLARIKANDIDVILPFPLTYEPDIEEHRKRYIKDSDWEALLKAIELLHPDQMPSIRKILKQRLLFNYNVIIAKKPILNDYCNWLFPILEKTEELSIPKGSDRADRYIGYMGETLETIYFMMNADKYDIVHAGCKFLE